MRVWATGSRREPQAAATDLASGVRPRCEPRSSGVLRGALRRPSRRALPGRVHAARDKHFKPHRIKGSSRTSAQHGASEMAESSGTTWTQRCPFAGRCHPIPRGETTVSVRRLQTLKPLPNGPPVRFLLRAVFRASIKPFNSGPLARQRACPLS